MLLVFMWEPKRRVKYVLKYTEALTYEKAIFLCVCFFCCP